MLSNKTRLEHIFNLEFGWLEPDYGWPPDPELKDWAFDLILNKICSLPGLDFSLYPTPDGGVNIEWEINGFMNSIEIPMPPAERKEASIKWGSIPKHAIFHTCTGSLDDLDFMTTLDLNDPVNEQKLIDLILKFQ